MIRSLHRAGPAVLVASALTAAGCGGGDDTEADTAWVADIEAAIDAVEDELGGPQRYFEVTASPQLTNVFVAVEDDTAAVPYVYVDGELQPPAPTLEGASGFTFAGDDVDIDEGSVLAQVEDQLPEATIAALSVEGADGELGGSVVRYVVSAQSDRGGFLDVTVAGDGRVLAVDPL